MNSSRAGSQQLPAEFVRSMRTLFDILDTRRSGFISYEDLARKWRRNPPSNSKIPPGFLDSLRIVAPPNGMLTFERFCAGLRLALAENRKGSLRAGLAPADRVRSDPNLHKPKEPSPPPATIAARRPLAPTQTYGSQRIVGNGQLDGKQRAPPAAAYPPADNYENIEAFARRRARPQPAVAAVRGRPPAPPPYGQLTARSVAALHELETKQFRPISLVSASSLSSATDQSAGGEPHVRWRDKAKMTKVLDDRRHTLADGMTPYLHKHERLLQEESDLLLRAVETSDRLRKWYEERQTTLRTRRRLIGQGVAAADTSVQEQQLNYFRAHSTELNRRMVALMESSSKGFPSHSNYETRRNFPQPSDDEIAFFKRHIQQLSDELSQRSAEVERLQAEKTAVIRQLFEQESRADHSTPPALVRPTPLSNGNHQPPAKPPKTAFATLM